MARILSALILLLLLSGCAITEKFATFETVITDPEGEQYTVCTKHGARATFKRADVEMEIDDRGHPESPGWFSNLMTLAGAKIISEGD